MLAVVARPYPGFLHELSIDPKPQIDPVVRRAERWRAATQRNRVHEEPVLVDRRRVASAREVVRA
jgi:hypothetical protein